MAEAIDNTQELVDDAGRGFQADVEGIVAEYREESRAIVAERDTALEEAELMRKSAEGKFARVYGEACAKCAAAIRESAGEWSDKSTRPDDLLDVGEQYVRPIVDGRGLLEPSFIVRELERKEKTRIETEQWRQKQQRRAAMRQGLFRR